MWRFLSRRLTPEVGWFAFSALVALHLLAGYSTYRADWSDGLIVTVRAIMLGTCLAYVLGRVLALPEWAAHPSAAVLGSAGILWLLQGLLSDQLGGWREKLAFLWVRWERWFSAVQAGTRAEDFYLFLLLMAIAHFLVGYLATWLLVRHSHPWVSVFLPTTVVLLNAGYSRHVSTLFVALVILLDLWIVGRVLFVQRMQRWQRMGLIFNGTVAWQSLWILAWLSVGVLLFGWIVPFNTHSSRVAAALQPARGPWMEVRDTLAQWFPSIRGPGGSGGGSGGYASFGDRFEIGGPLRLSDEPVLVLAANNAAYLTVRTYDTYTGRGWRSSAVPEAVESSQSDSSSSETAAPSQPVPLVEFAHDEELPKTERSGRERETLRYHIEVLQARGPALPVTGDPVAFSIPVRALYGWSESERWRTLDVRTTQREEVPIELRALIDLVRDLEFRPPERVGQGELTPTPDPYRDRPWFWWFMAGSPALPQLDRTLQQLADRGIEVTLWWEADGQGSFRISRIAYRGRLPDYADLEAVFPSEGMSRGLAYDIVTAVSRATPDQLRAAGHESGQTADDGAHVVVTPYGVYPQDLYQRYTQLPETVTQRTRELAASLAAGRSNAYDIASTIEAFVRERITYNEAAPIPSGLDAVDTILFLRPEGYCTFYASSMAVLLRAVGIPARVAVGYYPSDEYDSELGGFVYRDRNAHAWVEVFFPGYGWIPFEPTSSRPPIQRGTIPGQDDLLPLDPSLGVNLPTDERFGLLPPGLERAEGAGAVGSAAAGSGMGQGTVRTLVLSTVLIVLVGVGAALGLWWVWGTWRLSPTARLFARFQRLASVAGVRRRDSMTPLEFAWEVGRVVPGTRRAAESLARLYVRERYGRRTPSPEEVRLVSRAWREILRPRLVRAVLRIRPRAERGADHAE